MSKLNIVAETDEYLVVNKPAGLLTHGNDHIEEETLVDQILEKYPEIAKVGDEPSHPGIMHRLDRLVSGLLVVAKTQASFDNLKKQFKERTTRKYYTALVYGKMLNDDGEINFPIRRSSRGYKMAAVPETEKGKPTQGVRKACTSFSVTQHFINYSLLKVRIKTGRTHQIRVHMAAYGHPIVGDPIYNTKTTRAKNKKLGLERIFLVATRLSFKDLQGEEQVFEIDLPKDLQEFMKVVK